MCLLVRTSEGQKGVIARALMITHVREVFLSAVCVGHVARPGRSVVGVMGCKASFGRNKGVLKQEMQGKRRCKDRSLLRACYAQHCFLHQCLISL